MGDVDPGVVVNLHTSHHGLGGYSKLINGLRAANSIVHGGTGAYYIFWIRPWVFDDVSIFFRIGFQEFDLGIFPGIWVKLYVFYFDLDFNNI